MPVNLSESKIRVSSLLGTDAILGWLDPQLHMKVLLGTDTRWIVGLDSGNSQVTLAKASGGSEVSKAYPHQLVVDVVVASGHGWPNGTGSVNFTHNSGLRASGPPLAVGNGMVFLKSNGSTHTFTRG